MSLDTLRRRIPFQFSQDAGNENADYDLNETRILDDQQQDDVVNKLRKQSSAFENYAKLALAATMILSLILHMMHLFSDDKSSPLLPLFPSSYTFPVPLATPFALLAVVIHIVLLCPLLPGSIRKCIPPDVQGHLSSHIGERQSLLPLFAVASAAPIVSLLAGRAWQTTLWAAAPFGIVLLVHTVRDWTVQGELAVDELEGLRYTAPGA